MRKKLTLSVDKNKINPNYSQKSIMNHQKLFKLCQNLSIEL
jgi:hypothetical protein